MWMTANADKKEDQVEMFGGRNKVGRREAGVGARFLSIQSAAAGGPSFFVPYDGEGIL